MADSKLKIDYKTEYPDRQIVILYSDGNGRGPSTESQAVGGVVTKSFKLIANDEPASRHWRGVVGTLIAQQLKWDLSGGKAWHITNWPQGYSFWVAIRQGGRRDNYLYGGKRTYSSPVEFAPHALFLYKGGKGECRCWVCTGRTQSQVRQEMDLPSLGGSPHKNSPEKPTLMRRKSDAPARSNAVASSSRPTIISDEFDPIQIIKVDPKAHTIPKNTHDSPLDSFSRHRESDLRSGRRFRFGELVWASIPPLADPKNEEATIYFWPALIQEHWVHKESSLNASTSGEKAQPRYAIVESNSYRVMLLGVMHTHSLEENLIVPFQAHAVRNAVQKHLESLENVLTESTHPHRFFPIPAPASVSSDRYLPRTFDFALYSFKLALRIAELVKTKWSPTNKWTPEDEDSESEFFDSGRSKRRRCYQGLWWGPERIWVGDLVRVTLRRDLLEEAGIQETLLAPSPRAEARGLLLRISAITLDNRVGQFVIVGPLYEVAEVSFTGDASNLSISEAKSCIAFDASLSSPASAYKGDYPFPEPPRRYKFRRITRPMTEVSVPLQYIAGRYDPASVYAGIMRRFFNQERIESYQGNLQHEPDLDVMRLMSGHSLLVGDINAIKCEACLESRQLMMEKAESEARQELGGRHNTDAWRRVEGMD